MANSSNPLSLQMASCSNPFPETAAEIHEHLQCYLHASNANFSHFVTVKLSNIDDYCVWKTQMICLLEAHDMHGIVDENFDSPKASYDIKIMKKYDNLLKGWIFGSISRVLLDNVVELSTAKDVWDKLDSIYNPSYQRDSAKQESEDENVVMSMETGEADSVVTNTRAKQESEDENVVISMKTREADSVVTNTEAKQESEDENVVEIKISMETGEEEIKISRETGEEEEEEEDRMERKKKLFDASRNGNWEEARDILAEHKDAAREELGSFFDGTVLHLAVICGQNDFVRSFVDFIEETEVLEAKSKNGSTALHYAVLVDNKVAAQVLVGRNINLLTVVDDEGHNPLDEAYSSKNVDMFMCLYGANQDFAQTSNGKRCIREAIQYVVDAIYDNQFSTAMEMVRKFPVLAVESDDVLMALASTFPSGLTKEEEFFYPSSLDEIYESIFIASFYFEIFQDFFGDVDRIIEFWKWLPGFLVHMPVMVLVLILQLIWMPYVLFLFLYFLLWKVAAWSEMVPFIKHIMEKKNIWEEAHDLLKLVCDEIQKSRTLTNFDRPIIKAASHQNAYPVVKVILSKSDEPFMSKDKNGQDITQLAVMHRSENLYKLIHSRRDLKSVYGTLHDGSGNNILHLVARLPSSHELKPKRGAALQLQREIQWFKEVKKLLVPTYIIKENIFKETPDMVFTREHANLVKDAEAWMKTTAESCSIIAALITTIVFAAAITVPGGSNQDTGTPLLIRDTAFNIFGLSNAISLFMSSTSLLMFLSILTGRFAMEDFLVSLPRRLIIGLCTLLLSVTSMMVAFSATLFIVCYREKPWMLGPICGLASLPITFFVSVQFPLLIDLFESTYGDHFGE